MAMEAKAKKTKPKTEKSDVVDAVKSKPIFKPYITIVIVDTLNIYKEPSIKSKITGKLYKDTAFTFIDEQKGWGKLKSGMGWVSLSDMQFVKYV